MLAHGYGALHDGLARAGRKRRRRSAHTAGSSETTRKSIDDAILAGEPVRHLFYFGESMGAAIALQAAAVDLAHRRRCRRRSLQQSSRRNLRLRRSGIQPVARQNTFSARRDHGAFASRERRADSRRQMSLPKKPSRSRPFSVLLICGTEDHKIPCRHARRIYERAIGPKELWIVKGAGHSMAYGVHTTNSSSACLDFSGARGANEDAHKAESLTAKAGFGDDIAEEGAERS